MTCFEWIHAWIGQNMIKLILASGCPLHPQLQSTPELLISITRSINCAPRAISIQQNRVKYYSKREILAKRVK